MTVINFAKHAGGESSEQQQLGTEAASASRSGSTTYLAARRSPSIEQLIGTSAPMRELRETIERVARSREPVLIVGPTGSGKELVAQAIHELGSAQTGKFLPVNCGAIPDKLMESQLFGHVRGAFTGADSDQLGDLTYVGFGTLLLDEVAELPMLLQPKLLRVLETREFRPVGSQREQRFNGRLVASTHQDLERLVEAGTFRSDLFYRINVLHIRVPSLQERRDDIPELIKHFAKQDNRTLEFTSAAIEMLWRRSWPGNVRELRAVVSRAAVYADDGVVSPHLLEKQHMKRDNTEPESFSLQDMARRLLALPVERKLETIQKALIAEALALTGGNKSAAARLLGVHRKAIERRVLARPRS